MWTLTGSLNSGANVECSGIGQLLEWGWVGANEVGVTPFCALKNGELHKILQPFLRGHVFCALKFSSYKKETILKN